MATCNKAGNRAFKRQRSSRERTPAGKAGQRLNREFPRQRKRTGQVSLGEKKPPDRISRRGVGLLS